MTDDRGLGSLFGKAKKWAQQELKNATKIGGDPRKHHQAREENERLGREIEYDAKRQAQEAALEAVLPQSVKDYRDHAEADRVRRRTQDEATARAARAARAGDSTVTLTGAVTGTAGGLAIEAMLTDPGADLAVSAEAVDPVPMVGGTLTGFCFLIPGFHGDGTYELVDHPDFDSLQYELYLAEENEGWGFHPTYGPGVIVVDGGVADVRLVIGGAGSDTIGLTARITLGVA